ncbi:MAG: hypothetical protein Q9202_002694 [Teloschistes flavicans]
MSTMSALKDPVCRPSHEPSNDQTLAVRLSPSPTNATDRLASAFIYRAKPDLDINYQLAWNFGGYIWDIPARLGRNPAVDAAADVLVSAHARYCAGGHGPDIALLKKQALSTSILRQHLLDPAKALSTETLCAIALLMTSHVLSDPLQHMYYSHVRGAADLLKARGLSGPRDEFENKLILMIRGPIIFEALVNDKINFTKKELEDLVKDDITGHVPDGRFVEYLACVPDLTRRAKAVMQRRSVLPNPSWANLRHEIDEMRDRSKADIDQLRTRLQEFDPASAPPKYINHLHANHLRILSLALGTGIVLNWILLFLVGSDDVISLESAEWVEEIIFLAEIATQYRPLGSLAMIMGLHFAWFGATETSTKQRINALIRTYERVCTGEENDCRMTMFEPLMNRLSLEEA